METAMPIGAYLIQRLYECGVRHVFGVPGDFVLGFDKQLEDSPLVEFIRKMGLKPRPSRATLLLYAFSLP
jgi:TPP-dependent 2-oxoacid decarboxylase